MALFVAEFTGSLDHHGECRLGLALAALGISGACVLEIPGEGGPLLLATWGEVGAEPIEKIRQRWAERRAAEFSFSDPQVTCVVRSDGGRSLVLAVAGDYDQRRASQPLLAALLTIYHLAKHQRSVGTSHGAVEPARRLVFPPKYVRGVAAATVQLHSQMLPLAASRLPVLICGETGVGKELIARTLHLSSGRAEAPFVAINCAAIPADLLEAELFGIGRGVATGVVARRGLFLEAQGGTLLLDEIAEMQPQLQAKLLRVLQEQEVTPLGASPVPIDVRILSATNTEIFARMDEGLLRRDLFYRLAGAVLQLPPLRERRADIPLLVERFLPEMALEAGRRIRGISVAAQRALTRYGWPGNVRELEYEVRRLVYACPAGQAVTLRTLPENIRDQSSGEANRRWIPTEVETGSRGEGGSEASAVPRLPTLSLVELERLAIREALRRTGGHQTEAAQLLGLSRFALGRRLKRNQG